MIHLIGENLIHIKYLDALALYAANRARNEDLDNAPSGDGTSELPGYIMLDTDDDDQAVAGPASSDFVVGEQARQQSPQPAFRHAICAVNQSEQSAYEEAVSGNAVVPEGESPEFYVASCKERHANCNIDESGRKFLRKEDRQALRVDLNVLGVCRQLYEEANHLLWATNTFSFEDPKTFEKFFGSLNPAQKRNLTSVHISADIGRHGSWYDSPYQRARWDNNYWGRALNMSNLNMLRGVQALHLCLNQVFECVHYGVGNDPAEQQIEKAQQADMESILRLRALSVKHVTVVMSDDARKLDRDGTSAFKWTAIKKNEYAESIRVQLVDPRGAEHLKTETEAANLARKTEVRDNAAARVKNFKSALKIKQAEVARLAKLASREEGRAVLASQKATQALKKGLKKAVKLQTAAQRQKRKAIDVRLTADGLVTRLEFWHDQLATAREKYKRAMARMGATAGEIEDEEDAEMLMEGLSSSDMDVGEDDVAQTHSNVQSDGDESLVSRSEEEAFDEDDEFSSG